MVSMKSAVFLDRDGVLIKDVNNLTQTDDIDVFEYVPGCLVRLSESGFQLVVVSNQAVVARGLLTEDEMLLLNQSVFARIAEKGGPKLESFYYCPHHPNATLERYRKDCECRKPRPGLLIKAAADLNLDLKESFMVGDRVTDIIAGERADCRTILIETGEHTKPPIETAEPVAPVLPDRIFPSLQEATAWMISNP